MLFNNPASRQPLKDIRDEIFKISAKLDVIGERNKSADAIHNDHEGRLRALEKWRYAIPISSVSSIGAAAAAIVVAILH